MKNSVLSLVACILLANSSALAIFRNDGDREITQDVLKTFSRGCSLKVASDRDIVRNLESESEKASKIGGDAVLACFKNYYSQILGIFILYEKMCLDVGKINEKTSDDTLAYFLIDVSKYQSGIRPVHSSLNDCLVSVPDGKGKSFVVQLAGSELDVRLMQRELDTIAPKLPFPSTGEPLR